MAVKAQTGSVITGTVKGSDGPALKGVRVILAEALNTPVTAPPTPARRIVSAANSTDTGGFAFQNVAQGKFVICVQAGPAGYLDPCLWSATPPQFTIADQRPVNVGAITVQKGATLTVRLSDPSGLIAAEQAKEKTIPVTVGYRTDNGLFYPMRQVSSSPVMRTYAAAVANNQNVCGDLTGAWPGSRRGWETRRQRFQRIHLADSRRHSRKDRRLESEVDSAANALSNSHSSKRDEQ